ncbi:Linear gramicidin synthase subunit D [Candidatus Entotheonellaceae bacterium PAL068K]
MTDLESVLEALFMQGAELWAEGHNLRIRAPAGLLTQHLHTLRQHKAEILHLLPDYTFRIPLSYGQEALWFIQQSAPENTAYNLGLALQIHAAVDRLVLRQILQKLVNRHAILRTVFSAVDGVPMQVVQGYQDVCWQEIDATGWDWDAVMRAINEAHQRPFDLDTGPIFRPCLLSRSSQEHMLFLGIHHIACDGWSFRMMLDELLILYAEANGTEVSLSPVKRTYQQFTQWQREMLATEAERLRAYWTQTLSGELPTLNLPLDHPRPAVQTYNGAAQPFALSADLTDSLNAIAKGAGTTLYTTLLAAFHVLLHRYSGQEDIVIGSPAAGRDREEFATTVGYMVNPVVLRGNISRPDPPSFTTFLQQMRGQVLAALDHQDYPFRLLVQDVLAARDMSRSPVFQVMFVFQRVQGLSQDVLHLMDGESISVADWRLSMLELPQVTSEFDVILEMMEQKGCLLGSFKYNTDLFESGTITRLVGHFETLLAGIADDPGQRVANLPLLSAAERQQLLVRWNDTALDHPQNRCLHQLFEAQVTRTPHAVALVFGDEQLTYHRLNQCANQLGRYLQQLGVSPETRVGLCVERSIEMIVGLLGILKAGGAYVAFDPAYPYARQAFMVEDAAIPILLTQRHLAASLPTAHTHVVYLDPDWESMAREDVANLHTEVASHHLAYVLYTSGSTGQPKGVAIEHQSAVALLAWAPTEFPADVLTGVLASTSICFDLSVYELFVPLSCGGSVILADNALALPTLPGKDSVTLINTVPSAMTELVSMDEVPSRVRVVNLAGEPLSNTLVQHLYQHKTIQKVYNLYGPSEDTTYSTFVLSEKGAVDNPTIGRPINNTQAYILDEYLQPVPIGVPGELYLGGAGLARGYLNRAVLTAERFVPNPLGAGRLYQTGDLTRYRPDGTIEFLGRIDNQIKLRGFRIELGEIETVLEAHPQVQQSVVVSRKEPSGNHRLVAYWVAHGEDIPTTKTLHSHLRQKLPDFMIPAICVRLDAFPLTPNGKIDRLALPEPEMSDWERHTFVAPSTALETHVAVIWSDVLGIEGIGIYDDFFALGGHSLLATQVLSRLRMTLQMDLPLCSLFEQSTLVDLAAHIDTIQTMQKLRAPSNAAVLERQVSGRL